MGVAAVYWLAPKRDYRLPTRFLRGGVGVGEGRGLKRGISRHFGVLGDFGFLRTRTRAHAHTRIVYPLYLDIKK